jgi:membrane associated rhomboid family serine protease
MLLPIGLDDMRVRRWPMVCIVFAGLFTLALALTWLAGSGENGPAIFWNAGLIPARGVLQIGWLSHMFLHGGLFHLLGNLLFFYLVGPFVEDLWGRGRFLGLFLIGGVVAAAVQFALDPGFAGPIIGASGAIAACMGAFCIEFPRRQVRIFYWYFRSYGTFFIPVWLWAGLWFAREVLSLVVAGAGSEIAFGAHVGGFVFGVGAALAVGFMRRGATAKPAVPRAVAKAAPARPVAVAVAAAAAPMPPVAAATTSIAELERRGGDAGGPRYLR